MPQTAQSCACCNDPITEIEPLSGGNSVRQGHCTNPACAMYYATMELSALAALTPETVRSYAIPRFAHLLRQASEAADETERKFGDDSN